jgi:hypothetical protein
MIAAFLQAGRFTLVHANFPGLPDFDLTINEEWRIMHNASKYSVDYSILRVQNIVMIAAFYKAGAFHIGSRSKCIKRFLWF